MTPAILNDSSDPIPGMKYRVLIFGAGAIGTYIGFHLLLGNHQVVFLEREKDLDGLMKRGLSMEIDGQTNQLPSPTLISDLEEIKNEPFDLAILTLKTYHLKELLPELNRIKEHLPPILSLLNGIKSEQILQTVCGEGQVIPGTVTTAVDRMNKGEIIVRKSRGVGISGNHPLVPGLIHAFNDVGLLTKHYHYSESMKWSKLILNQLGNASAAILNMTTAEIYQDPRLFRMEHQAVLETISIMDQLGIIVVNLPKIPVKLLVFIFKYIPLAISHPLLSKLIGGGRGDKMPSFHIDLHSGKGKSEVDHLNGAIAQMAEEEGISTPVNSTLTDVLLKLTSGIEPISKYDHNPQQLLGEISSSRHHKIL
jgi:2-dehydropantoate 2-reductase